MVKVTPGCVPKTTNGADTKDHFTVPEPVPFTSINPSSKLHEVGELPINDKSFTNTFTLIGLEVAGEPVIHFPPTVVNSHVMISPSFNPADEYVDLFAKFITTPLFFHW